MYEVDARGLSCPEPVLMAAEAMKKHGNEAIKILVSEPYVRYNVEKFVKNQGRLVTVTEQGDEFELVIEQQPASAI